MAVPAKQGFNRVKGRGKITIISAPPPLSSPVKGEEFRGCRTASLKVFLFQEDDHNQGVLVGEW
jgi:hypothetical protein